MTAHGFRRWPKWAWAIGLALLLAASGLAAQETAVRVGDHPGFGRVVFALPSKARFETVRAGDRLLLVFQGAGVIERPSRMPRNVAAIEGGDDSATIVLAPGAEVRTMRMGERLVIDVLDRAATTARPTAPRTTRLEPRPAESVFEPRAPEPKLPEAKRPEPQPAAETRPAQPHAPVTPPPGNPPPVARPVPAPPPARAGLAPEVAGAAPAQAVPAQAAPVQAAPVQAAPVQAATVQAAPAQAAQAPAAPVQATQATPAQTAPLPAALPQVAPVQVAPVQAVQREDMSPPAVASVAASPPQRLVLAADAATGAAAFRRGTVGIVVLDRRPPGAAMAEAGTGGMLQIPLPPGMSLSLSRVAAGWAVVPVQTAPPATLVPAAAPGGIAFPMARPGRVVTLLDPVSGATLLVGTSLDPGPASAQAEDRRTPAFSLVASWLGVVVEAASDGTDLRAVQSGFLLAGGPLPTTEPGTSLTRRFDLPGGDAAALTNRMRAQLLGAATALPRARAEQRLAAASTMVALGLAAEAQALAQLAAAEDPQAAADAGPQGLAAVAALLAGRLAETDALDDKRLDGSDEIELWRGLRDRRLGRNSAAAKGLGRLTPLVLSYPATLGRLLLPDLAEAAVESGAPFPEDRLTPYAKVLLMERRGKVAEAVAAYEELAKGPDRLDQVRGTVRAAELRLASGQLPPLDAAAVMERQAFAWRGDAREAGFRMRAAELRGQAGEWRGALDALREIESTFPDQKELARGRMAGVMQAMLAADGGALSPLDVVLLAMEHADAVMGGEAGAALSRLLAAKLSVLDLPARAIPVLQGLMRGVPPGEARATLGARLAQVLLDGEEPGAALAALEGSAAANLPDALLETRALMRARVLAAQGGTAAAAEGLAALGTAKADDLRAALLGKAGDWPGAAAALADLAAKLVPAAGPLDAAAQEIMLRQATAAAQAGDAGMLRSLAPAVERLTPPRDALFRVLTAAPVTAVSDLPRAARELKLARALPLPARNVAGR